MKLTFANEFGDTVKVEKDSGEVYFSPRLPSGALYGEDQEFIEEQYKLAVPEDQRPPEFINNGENHNGAYHEAVIAWAEANLIDPYVAPPLSWEEENAETLTFLEDIDKKSVRALREGDTARIAALETEASSLRATLTPRS